MLTVIPEITDLASLNDQNKKYLKENPKSEIVPYPLQGPVNSLYRASVCDVEKRLEQRPDAVYADYFPLRHSFAEGVYLRELYVPKGMFLVTKLHRVAYFSFLMFGDLTVLTEEGGKRIQGPCIIPSAAGAKRIAFAHEDFIWATVHPNPDNCTDIEKLEAEIHVEGGYDELDNVIDMGSVDSADVNEVFRNFIDKIKANEGETE
jgi:hypothetical protein